MNFVFRSTDKKTHPGLELGMKVPYAPAKRGGYRGRWYLLLLLLAAPVILGIWIFARPLILVLAPGIVTTEPLEVRSPYEGRVSEVHVDPGAVVSPGQLLVSLSDPLIQARLDELRKKSGDLPVGASEGQAQVLEQLLNSIEVAEKGVAKQAAMLRDFESYREQKLITVADTVAILRHSTDADLSLESAKAAYFRELAAQEVEQKAGEIARLRLEFDLEIEELQAKLDAMKLVAPFAATVADVATQSGAFVTPDTTLFWLAGRDRPVVIAYLDPKYLHYGRIGQMATIGFPSGEDVRAEVLSQPELVGRLPSQLLGPFEGEKPALKVTLTPQDSLPTEVEGVPVEVRFDRHFDI